MSNPILGPKLKKDIQQALYNLSLCKDKIEKAESCGIDCQQQREECDFLFGFLTQVLEKYAGGAPKAKDG